MTDTERQLALTVPCIYCHVPAGQQCTNTLTKQPLVKLAAHWIRLKAAKENQIAELF